MKKLIFFLGSFNLNITLWKINSAAAGGSIIYYNIALVSEPGKLLATQTITS
jgi:hypothetical protein